MGIKLLFLLSVGFLLGACASENGEDLSGNGLPTPACTTAGVTYTLTVAPLLQQHCVQCHNSALAFGGINLSTHAQLRPVALDKKFIGSIDHEPGYFAMPLGSAKLGECDINKLRQWVADGAPNN